MFLEIFPNFAKFLKKNLLILLIFSVALVGTLTCVHADAIFVNKHDENDFYVVNVVRPSVDEEFIVFKFRGDASSENTYIFKKTEIEQYKSKMYQRNTIIFGSQTISKIPFQRIVQWRVDGTFSQDVFYFFLYILDCKAHGETVLNSKESVVAKIPTIFKKVDYDIYDDKSADLLDTFVRLEPKKLNCELPS